MPFWISAWIFSNCVPETTGPTVAPLFGSPTSTPAAAAAAISLASSIRAAGTSMRDGALQVWPELPIIVHDARTVTLCANAASSSTMFGLLPPSSWATRLTVGAALRATSMPARVDPVNDTMSMSGWLASATPTPGPSPWIRLNTPAGTPAVCRISAKSCAENGATSDGLSTDVQPVASAGKTLTEIWFNGQFHGVISPQTPIGSLTMVVSPRCSLKEKFFERLDGRRQVAETEPDLWPGRQPCGCTHLLGHGLGEIACAVLVFGQDRVENLEPLLARRHRPGRERPPRGLRRPCPRRRPNRSRCGQPPARWRGSRCRRSSARRDRPTGRRCRTSDTRA